MRHQIAFVGAQLLPVFIGIKEFEPDTVHFIVSNESRIRVTLLKSLLRGRSFTEHTCNPFDFGSIKATCETILGTIQPEDEVQLNLTGGTKIMVLAAQALITERRLKGFYVNQNGTLLQLPSYDLQKLTSGVSVKEFLEISGHKLYSSKTLADYTSDDFRTIDEIERFATTHERLYFQAMSKIRNGYDRLSAIPPSGNIALNKSSNLLWTQKSITINSSPSDIFRIESPNTRNLFFNASWWELMVARHISNWPSAKELLMQCELPFRTDDKIMKNEIDILINLGGRLMFVECKSGNVRQEDVNKMKIVKDTYGGVVSKSLLVCRFIPSSTIMEKCDELNVDVFYIYDGRKQVNQLRKIVHTLDRLEKKLTI